MKPAVYPGTFDPITYGHLDLIQRATRIFKPVIIAVAENPYKDPLFDVRERVEMVKRGVKELRDVQVESFDGLVVDYVKAHKSCVIVRGLRMLSDFEYEFQMALTNRKFCSEVETIFMMPNESYSYLSSKLIKEAAMLGACIKDFVPSFVEKALQQKMGAVRTGRKGCVR